MTGEMSAITSVTKVAWIRDASVPAGRPATGRFNCPCGNVISGVSFGDGLKHGCTCGRVFDSRGWIVQEQADCLCGDPANAHEDRIGICDDCLCHAYRPTLQSPVTERGDAK